MIVVTGAAGFIGSALVTRLNQEGITNLLLVDDFTKSNKDKNLEDKQFYKKVDRADFINSIDSYGNIECIFHIGARTDTTEFDKAIFDRLNLNYSKNIWQHCTKNRIPLIYASSAATYGGGEHGFDDNSTKIPLLQPLNPYGDSKQLFDVWALEQETQPPFWIGLKFFNVYGPNEYHKGRMASVVMHAFNQIKETKSMKLFMSHNENFKNGGQLRDFVYIKDVLSIIMFWYQHQNNSGIYNLGTGEARTFNDLAKSVFLALNLEPDISFIPTPEDIRDKYQYYTQAEMQRTIHEGYKLGFTSLEDGITDYVQNYLLKNEYY
jgi:ADP-L-glycero-D-manno-heptose 6-epimerase